MFLQTDNVRSRKYFKTEKEAYDYCYAQAKQQEEATPVLAEVNAKEIIEYRNSELIARKLGMSMSDACDLYVDARGKLMRENLPSLFELFACTQSGEYETDVIYSSSRVF